MTMTRHELVILDRRGDVQEHGLAALLSYLVMPLMTIRVGPPAPGLFSTTNL
jgi:hypothetical protein